MPFWLAERDHPAAPDRGRGAGASCASAATRRSRRRRCWTSSSGTAPATGTTTARTCTSPSPSERQYAIRPMNCPGACLVFGAERHSYRELPLRLAEFGQVSRAEREGVLHGLLRVRAFTQDDAHVYCTPEQIVDEVTRDLRGDRRALRALRLRRRAGRALDPAGEVDRDRRAVGAGRGRPARALERQGREYQLNPGDGAFYGPKIDFHVTDALGRSWQCGTCQVDFFMPERFDLTYTDADDEQRRPVMIHRALLGSMERFAGILIEHHAGRFPVWLAPVQATVLPVADRHVEYARPGRGRAARGGGAGSRSTSAPSRSGRRSATPSWAATPTCWWSATASRRPARSRCARTRRASWGRCRWPSSPTRVARRATPAEQTSAATAGPASILRST